MKNFHFVKPSEDAQCSFAVNLVKVITIDKSYSENGYQCEYKIEFDVGHRNPYVWLYHDEMARDEDFDRIMKIAEETDLDSSQGRKISL